mgnify:CR=1 FL=1
MADPASQRLLASGQNPEITAPVSPELLENPEEIKERKIMEATAGQANGVIAEAEKPEKL